MKKSLVKGIQDAINVMLTGKKMYDGDCKEIFNDNKYFVDLEFDNLDGYKIIVGDIPEKYHFAVSADTLYITTVFNSLTQKSVIDKYLKFKYQILYTIEKTLLEKKHLTF